MLKRRARYRTKYALELGQRAPFSSTWASRRGQSRQFLLGRVRTTAGQAGISGGDPKEIPIPLPPLAEQHRIVAEVDRRLSVLDKIEASVELNLARCARLRQSILKRAFEGRLVKPEAPSSQDASAHGGRTVGAET